MPARYLFLFQSHSSFFRAPTFRFRYIRRIHVVYILLVFLHFLYSQYLILAFYSAGFKISRYAHRDDHSRRRLSRGVVSSASWNRAVRVAIATHTASTIARHTSGNNTRRIRTHVKEAATTTIRDVRTERTAA